MIWLRFISRETKQSNRLWSHSSKCSKAVCWCSVLSNEHTDQLLFKQFKNTAPMETRWSYTRFKKDCSLDKSNYRPATILPLLSKMFASIVHARLCRHFENIYHKYVFASRKHCGCDTAILSLTERWKQELDNHEVIGEVSMDLSKVFDILPHDLIVLN